MGDRGACFHAKGKDYQLGQRGHLLGILEGVGLVVGLALGKRKDNSFREDIGTKECAWR